jgi:hypothetical protein
MFPSESVKSVAHDTIAILDSSTEQASHEWQNQVAATDRRVASVTAEPRVQAPEWDVVAKNLPFFELSILSLFGTFLLLYLTSFRRTVVSSKEETAQPTGVRIPCKRCQFYSSNFYLQCAVHPSKVLKPESADCPDYCGKYEQSDQPLIPKK